MGRESFMGNIRRAVGLLKPTVEVNNNEKLDAGAIAQSLENAAMWLTPKSVEGFCEEDFADLPDPTRAELARRVAGFEAIAREVPSDEPAKKNQAEEAKKHLSRIAKIVL